MERSRWRRWLHRSPARWGAFGFRALIPKSVGEPTGKQDLLVQFARGEIGRHPYLWGAKVFGQTAPLDCSGFSQVCFQQIGVEIGPGTWHQREYCKAHGQLVTAPYQAADILFFMDDGPVTPSHVGIATDEGTVIEETASFTANVVESPITPRWSQPFVEGWRIL
ncbi:MAG: NlpC/P60 family protein [Dehalococcoidia bacterium]|nr:NlpC/P60 family protein [Dehalococcoidia bacterium]